MVVRCKNFYRKGISVKEYDVVISTKGQFVLPKEVRDKFRLSPGSKIKVVVDGEQIILKPRTISDELEEYILADIARDGKPINEETIREYKRELNKTLDKIVAESEQEYQRGDYITLADLKRENENV